MNTLIDNAARDTAERFHEAAERRRKELSGETDEAVMMGVGATADAAERAYDDFIALCHSEGIAVPKRALAVPDEPAGLSKSLLTKFRKLQSIRSNIGGA